MPKNQRDCGPIGGSRSSLCRCLRRDRHQRRPLAPSIGHAPLAHANTGFVDSQHCRRCPWLRRHAPPLARPVNLTLDFLGMPGPGTARGAQIWLGILAVGTRYPGLGGLVAPGRTTVPGGRPRWCDVRGLGDGGRGRVRSRRLKAIGDTTLFLIIAAVVGISYTVKELYWGR
jgi:hypothetical protein